MGKEKTSPTECVPWLKALADETRFAIMQQLINRPLSVGEVAKALGLTHYNASKHLRILREAGLIEQKIQGRVHEYTVTPDFRRRMSSEKTCLDLGCCSFQFEQKKD
ncbi:MAG TPA: winged helix-turn-helix domain-containing protein [Verrucomicrobiae bacterium]